MDSAETSTITQLAEMLRRGVRIRSYARDGQAMTIELLPRSRTAPAIYLLRLGEHRERPSEVFIDAQVAAARTLELGWPELIAAMLVPVAE